MSEISNETQNKKQRLGRGLGSLLGGQSNNLSGVSNSKLGSIENTLPPAPMPVPMEARVWQIQVEKLVPSKLQPRTNFDKEKLEELAVSIKQHGILQPIAARKLSSGAFEIIAGERRWRAAQIAGLYEVPVIIKTLSNKDTLELAIIENIQREDLSPIEEAEAYRRLSTEFGLTQQQVAEKVGKDRATVANSLRLLTLSAEIKALINEGKISQGHCKVLLGLDDEKTQTSLAKKVAEQQLSVRKLEQEILKLKAGPTESKTEGPRATVSAVIALQEQLQKSLGTRVAIDYHQGKGKISLSFYSDEELNKIVEQIKAGKEI